MELKDKTFLVVGGSSGIGLETVRQLSDAGASVIVWSRTKSEALEALDIEHHEVDVTTELGELPIPEGLAGVGYFPGSINLAPFERVKIDAFQSDFEINLLGAVRVFQKVVPALAKSGGGSVVAVSTVAVQTGMAYHTSVAAAKGALEGLIRSLAAEYAPKDVRVNAIAPSLTDTPMAGRLVSSDEKKERSAERHPLKRIGTPEEMARAACYLLSDESPWVTGQVLHLDGGMSSLR
jgi:NAD(P)-dependent dehydrogenase (short-subunit alcohol dehydrogenase family)